MIAIQKIFPSYTTTLFDAKSQISTQSEENLDFHSYEHFSLPLSNSLTKKTANCKHKSSLCKNFSTTGHCPYGQRCQFAHGSQQLRINYDLNNSYKTKPCNCFFKKGHCQYGFRCNFLHQQPKETEEETNQQKQVRNDNWREFFISMKESDESRLLKLLE